MTIDPCHRGRAIHIASKGEVPYQARNSSSKGRSKRSLAMLGGWDQS